MTNKTISYYITCNKCGKEYEEKHTGYTLFIDEMDGHNRVSNDNDWHVGDTDDHYCPDCFTVNEDDNVVIK